MKRRKRRSPLTAMLNSILHHRIDRRTLTDMAAGVKLIVYEKLTGAARAPVESAAGYGGR
jgi:hypothetical protein